tara:strand:- start:3956 stop:4816 length:861 start_codon:yes stop_codon:yes gene_type:complete
MYRKIIIKRNQLKSIISEIGEVLPSNEIRGYAFDWDDNILFMPTKIKLEKKEGTGWKPLSVSTEEFSTIRDNPDYRLTSYSFDDFANPEIFMQDVRKAIEQNKFAPSFGKLKEALTYANPFSIITARGTQPHIIKEGIKLLIGMTFETQEVEMMLESIENNFPSTVNMTTEEKIDFYLSDNDYSPVSSKEFKDKFGLDQDADRPELGKKIALKDYVDKVVNGVKKITGGDYSRLSIGFSDDDRKNIETVVNYIKDELSIEYPEINFIVYDTSTEGENKIVVSRANI